MNSKRIVAGLGFLACLLLGITWLALDQGDREFHGKLESAWIEEIAGNPPYDPVEKWRSFGPAGVQVLSRGLDNRRNSWTIKCSYLWSCLPLSLQRFLPGPTPTSERAVCTSILKLLGQLNNDVEAAMPAVSRALEDPDLPIRRLAFAYYIQGEDTNAPLHQAKLSLRRKLFPYFKNALQDSDSEVRNHALVALGYFPEESETITPLLLPLLQPSGREVRLRAADSLQNVSENPEVQAMAIRTVIVAGAYNLGEARVHRSLRRVRQTPELTVPVLLGCVRDKDSRLARSAIAELAHYPAERERIVPVLFELTQNTNAAIANLASYTLETLERTLHSSGLDFSNGLIQAGRSDFFPSRKKD